MQLILKVAVSALGDDILKYFFYGQFHATYYYYYYYYYY